MLTHALLHYIYEPVEALTACNVKHFADPSQYMMLEF